MNNANIEQIQNFQRFQYYIREREQRFGSFLGTLLLIFWEYRHEDVMTKMELADAMAKRPSSVAEDDQEGRAMSKIQKDGELIVKELCILTVASKCKGSPATLLALLRQERGDKKYERHGHSSSRGRVDSTRDSSTSSMSTDDEEDKIKRHKTQISRKSYRQHDDQTAGPSRSQERPKKQSEKIPYFIDAKREEDRLRRKYGHDHLSRSRRRSTSRSRRRHRTRSYSRERRRSRHRSYSRERHRRSTSYDRHRSRRRSRTPDRRHISSMMAQSPSSYIPLVPVQYPFPPQFVPAPYPPRFPHGGVLRPPYPPPVVYYVPQPLVRPMGRWMNRPIRPKRNY